MSASPTPGPLVFLCDCGPIIRDLMDLDALQARTSRACPDVGTVERHATLCSAEGKALLAEKMRENPDLLPGRRRVLAARARRDVRRGVRGRRPQPVHR